MKYAPIALAAAIATLASTAAFAAPTAKAKPVAKAAPDLTCPVTGEKIASIKDAAGSSSYKGKTYYFCCAGCKPAFDKAPTKYVKTASAAPKAKTPAKTPKAVKAG